MDFRPSQFSENCISDCEIATLLNSFLQTSYAFPFSPKTSNFPVFNIREKSEVGGLVQWSAASLSRLNHRGSSSKKTHVDGAKRQSINNNYVKLDNSEQENRPLNVSAAIATTVTKVQKFSLTCTNCFVEVYMVVGVATDHRRRQ